MSKLSQLQALEQSLSPAQEFKLQLQNMSKEGRDILHLTWRMNKHPTTRERFIGGAIKIQACWRAFVAQRAFKKVWMEHRREMEQQSNYEFTLKCYEDREYQSCIEYYEKV